MNFRAIAKNPGKCALAKCTLDGRKIYDREDGLKILACTQGHADAVERILETPPPGVTRDEFMAKRWEAIKLLEQRVTAREAAQETVPDPNDYDIDF